MILVKIITVTYFYSDYSAVFATCSKEDIRVWNANTSKELLRIVVPNMTCHAVDFMKDGKTIISGNFSCYLTSYCNFCLLNV